MDAPACGSCSTNHVLKRLKDEFPELKIGGPAHSTWRPDLIDMIKAECDKRNVKPDFYSYHLYANTLEALEKTAARPPSADSPTTATRPPSPSRTYTETA